MKSALEKFFSELLVVELANVLAGPSVGMFLAGLGARVVKVENPHTGGDVTRSWKLPSESGREDISAYFSAINWGKHSVALDLKTPEGKAAARSLCLDADIVLSSFKKGDAEKLGLDAPTLRSETPQIITGAITGYGSDSPRVGYDAVIQAESGFMFLNGQTGGPPTKMPVALTDVLAAHQLKQGILLALLERQLSGRGSDVSVSLFDTAVLSLVNKATNYLVTGIEPTRQGSLHQNIAPYGEVFQSQDGREILLAVGTDHQFQELLDALGLAALASDARFCNNQARVANRSSLEAVLSPVIRSLPLELLLKELAARDVPAGPIRSVSEVCALPEVEQRLLLSEISAEGTHYRGLKPFAFSLSTLHSQPTLTRPPHLGEQNDLYGFPFPAAKQST